MSFICTQAPINDHQAASGLIGIKPSTKNAHIVRAVLESIVFRVAQLYACTVEETEYTFSVIKYIRIYIFNRRLLIMINF